MYTTTKKKLYLYYNVLISEPPYLQIKEKHNKCLCDGKSLDEEYYEMSLPFLLFIIDIIKAATLLNVGKHKQVKSCRQKERKKAEKKKGIEEESKSED